MKRSFLIVILFITILQLHSQDAIKHFNKGLTLFNSGNYSTAIEQFSKAIEINPHNKDFYFNRGVTYYNNGDTCKACNDFQTSLQYGDLQARNLIMINCFKCDELSHGYFKKSQIAISNENYELADSLLTQSIESDHYLENYFQRGLLRLYLNDTLGFCSDMRTIYSLDDAAKINCQTYCTDTVFFDKSFIQVLEQSDYYEVRFKPGFGALYNQKRKSSETSYKNPHIDQYWVNDYMIGYYNIINNVPVYLIAKNDINYNSVLSDFFNDNLLVDVATAEILKRNGQKKYTTLVNVILSSEGIIKDVIVPPSTSRQLSKFKDSNDLLELNETILNKILELSKKAPTAKPAKIGKRFVNFQYSIWITLEI